MGLISMTGYGKGRAVGKGLSVETEIKSVNRKQLDVVLSASRVLSALEVDIRRLVADHITRGRVHCDLSVTLTGEHETEAIRVDKTLAAAYVKKLRAAAKELGLDDTLDTRALIDLPNVVQYRVPDIDEEELWTVSRRAVEKALRGLRRMRKSEGSLLEADLRQRVKEMEKALAKVEKEAPRVAEAHRVNMLERLAQEGVGLDVEDERVVREVALFADRSDITEEITRLRSHVKQMRAMFASREPCGRALDFLAQEMFREINTIGSKGNSALIAQQVVVMKSELEKCREQIQNIE